MDGELREIIGEGGIGVVHRSPRPGRGRDVAIEVLKPGMGENPLEISRFRREARVAARPSHPRLVKVHDLVTIDDYLPPPWSSSPASRSPGRSRPVPTRCARAARRSSKVWR